jgi:hypothetical protein
VRISAYIVNASVHVTMSSMGRHRFFRVKVKTNHPSNMSFGSGSCCWKFTAMRSENSTNFPEQIWATNLSGIGEKPGPTTNGWLLGICGIFAERHRFPSDRSQEDGKVAAIVLINEDTTRFDLPCWPGEDVKEVGGTNQMPEDKKS